MSAKRKALRKGRKRRSKSPKFLGATFQIIAIVFTAIAAIALLMTVIAPYVNPNSMWVFSFMGLAAPFIYIANVLILLFWIVTWQIYFVIPLFFLLIGANQIGNFFQIRISREYDDRVKSSDELVFMSYNVRGFLGKNDDGVYVSTTNQILNKILEINPDIIAFQEFQTTPSYPQNYIDSVLIQYPYKRIYHSISNGDIGIGLAVYSKFYIAGAQKVNLEKEYNFNSSMCANIIVTRGDTLRVVNNHLQTTQIDQDNISFIERGVIESPNKKQELKNIGRKLRNNYMKRANQADSIANFIREDDVRTIVCGDFNDTPISYVYRRVRGDYKDAFREAGSGYNWTFKQFLGVLCIDYIFYSEGLDAQTYQSPYFDWSDHNPVISTFKITPLER